MKKVLEKIYYLYPKIISLLPFGCSPFPLSLTIELTYRCNLNCSMCYLRKEENIRRLKMQKEMTTEEIKKIISQAPKITAITFTGGEVFLRNDFMNILKFACRSHRTGIITNGTMIEDNHLKNIVKLGVSSIMFSLDGPKDIHNKIRGQRGLFEKTINTVGKLQKIKSQYKLKRPIVTINSVITNDNVSFLEKIAQDAKNLQVDNLSFQYCDTAINRSGYHLSKKIDFTENVLSKVEKIDKKILKEQLIKAKKTAQKSAINFLLNPRININDFVNYYQQNLSLVKLICFRVWTHFRISPFGKAYPCFNYYLGDLKTQKLMDIWNSKKMRQFRQKVKKNKIFPACIGCCHLQRR